jgi:hypothetical protein
LLVFGYVAGEYAFRTYLRKESLSDTSIYILNNRRFRLFIGGIFVAYLTIFIRCVYRIPELLGGWGSSLMRIESEFIALEGVMIVLAVAAQTIFHPGYCFPAMAGAHTMEDDSRKLQSMDSELQIMNRA